MKLEARLIVAQGLEPATALTEELDQRFKQPYPLAPSDLLKSGTIQGPEYRRQNRNFGQAACEFLLEEIEGLEKLMKSQYFKGGVVVHLGIGQGDDMRYVKAATAKGLHVVLVDASHVVCRKTLARLNRITAKWPPDMQRPEVLFADAEKFATSGTYTSSSTLVMYLSRLIQLMSAEKMRNTLRGLGEVLKWENRRIVLVHPFPQDNEHIVWGRTHPYQLSEILATIKEGAGSPVRVIREKKIPYYSQVYSAFTVEAM